MSNCKSCGAAIFWVESANGKRMPLDAAPEKRIVIDGGIGRVVDTYTSHFSTCPNAAEHRKPREGGVRS
jgi:hypothetical protein